MLVQIGGPPFLSTQAQIWERIASALGRNSNYRRFGQKRVGRNQFHAIVYQHLDLRGGTQSLRAPLPQSAAQLPYFSIVWGQIGLLK